jgi:hypothetical protein
MHKIKNTTNQQSQTDYNEITTKPLNTMLENGMA